MGRPQGIINKQIGEYDIFIGMMWKRFGTPTGKAGSGTEEEFRLAYEYWETTKSVMILFYFCQAPFMPRVCDKFMGIMLRIHSSNKSISSYKVKRHSLKSFRRESSVFEHPSLHGFFY